MPLRHPVLNTLVAKCWVMSAIRLCVCACVCTHPYVYVCARENVCVCLCVRLCVCVCVRVCDCVCVYLLLRSILLNICRTDAYTFSLRIQQKIGLPAQKRLGRAPLAQRLRGGLEVHVCCGVLQCVAVCCSVLQCVAVCCSVFQSTQRHTYIHIQFFCRFHAHTRTHI